MDYQIWIQDYEGSDWKRIDAGDKGAVKRIILQGMKEGKKPVLTVEVPFVLKLEIGDAAKVVKDAEQEPEPAAEGKQEETKKDEVNTDQTE